MFRYFKILARAAITGLVIFAGSVSAANQDPTMVDPWEPFNRKVFAFNEMLDGFILKPMATGYRAITPDVIDKGVTNFFNNIAEVSSAANAVLQCKPYRAMTTTGRFMFNTTFGILGFFDVATKFGVERTPEDFGQTLGYWGVPTGPYVVLPALGPATVRSGTGRVIESVFSPLSMVLDDQPFQYYALSALNLVDLRADLISKEGLVIGDKYSFVRNAYLQYRRYLNQDGVVSDPFAAEDDSYLDEF